MSKPENTNEVDELDTDSMNSMLASCILDGEGEAHDETGLSGSGSDTDVDETRVTIPLATEGEIEGKAVTAPTTPTPEAEARAEAEPAPAPAPAPAPVPAPTPDPRVIGPEPGALNRKRFVKSDAYVEMEQRFTRDRKSNILLFDGRPVCRYFCTTRGCQSGSACRFLHVRLGCVFNQLAPQGCLYQDQTQCPFSHDPDVPVVAGKLWDCSNPNCDRCCMRKGSTCLRCFNRNSRRRRSVAMGSRARRRQMFQPGNMCLTSPTGEVYAHPAHAHAHAHPHAHAHAHAHARPQMMWSAAAAATPSHAPGQWQTVRNGRATAWVERPSPVSPVSPPPSVAVGGPMPVQFY